MLTVFFPDMSSKKVRKLYYPSIKKSERDVALRPRILRKFTHEAERLHHKRRFHYFCSGG